MMLDFTPPALALFGPIGTPELIILAILGLLIFGKRLPEVGKSVGKGIVEFKRGLQGIEDELDQQSQATPTTQRPPDQIEPRDTPSQTTDASQQTQPADHQQAGGSSPHSA